MKLSLPSSKLDLILVLLLIPSSVACGATIHVPTDQPTIQAAINAASNGDTVLVAPGTYQEIIDFKGKAITVTSSGGPKVTTIDGGQIGSVVTFQTNEGLTSVLNGFTITNGLARSTDTYASYDGGGISIFNASPTITNNIVTGNQACSGAGVAISAGSPLVQGNTITQNTQGGCTGGILGGGIYIQSGGSAQIIGNLISNNTIEYSGAGIGLDDAGTPTIENNTIIGNSSSGVGGGIGMINDSDANVVQNIVAGNSATDSGGGISCFVPGGTRGCFLINNTIANNSSPNPGSEVLLSGFYAQVQIVNNIISADGAQTALFCDSLNSQAPPILDFNDVFNSAGGPALGGSCTFSGTSGNISADPLFFDPVKNFHLRVGSPATGAGTNSAPDLPSTDLDGNPRIVNGTVDMGAYEYLPTTMIVSSTSLNFGSVPFGTTSATQPITITNTGNNPLTLMLVVSGDFTENDNCVNAVAAGAYCTVSIAFAPTAVGVRSGSLTLTGNSTNSPVTIGLTGTAPGASAALSTSSLSFGSQLQGTTSVPQVVTITNSGLFPLLITSVTVSTGFTQTNTCSAPVAATSNCSVSVSFAPTSAGSFAGSLTITDNAPGTPQTVTLTGTGYAYPTPQITPPLQPASTAPGSDAFTLTVNGTGFFAASVVQWNQTALPTTFANPTQLTAQVSAAEVAAAGTALVRVVNPTPGGGTSNAAPFEITTGNPTLAFNKTDLTVGQYPFEVAEGDFNGDGRPDLVVTNENSGTISVLLGNGDGTFQTHVDYVTGLGPNSVVVADFNHDGKADLAVSNEGCPPNSSACGTPNISIFLGHGDGTFQSPLTLSITGAPVTLVAGDFNGDGKVDLAVSVAGGQGGNVAIFLGNGDGTFQAGAQYRVGGPTAQPPSSMVTGDFNRDGKLDLIVNDWYPASDVAVLLGNGDGTFQGPVEYSTGLSPYTIAAGDFNGDGILDLATVTNENTVSVLLGNGDGTFQTHVDYATGVAPIRLTAADLNGDGKLDLAVTDYTANTVSVLLGNGDGTFQENQDFPTESGPQGIVAADFNGDGRMDLAVANSGSNNVSVLMQVSGASGPVVSLSAASLTFAAQMSGTTSTAQGVTLTNTGSAALAVSTITASGDFSQTDTCGTSVAAGANCTISVTFKPTAGGTRTGTLSIADNAAGSPQSVALSGTGEDFTFTAASGSSTSSSVTPGQSATYTLSVGGQEGMSGTVTFTCTGAPSEASCTVSPNPVTVGNSATNVTVKVTTTAPTMGVPRSRPLPPILPISQGSRRLVMSALLLAMLAWIVGRRNRPGVSRCNAAMVPLALGLLLTLALAGCGGGGGGGPTTNPGTPAGTFTLTVTGTAGSGSSGLSHSVTLTLTVG